MELPAHREGTILSLSDLTLDQRELAQLISSISQSRYCAGWMLGIEAEVWRALHAPTEIAAAIRLTAAEVTRLHELSARCGGWIVFDEVCDETFVPMNRWLARFGG